MSKFQKHPSFSLSIALKRTLRLQQTLSKIGKAFFKNAPIIRKRAAKEMHKRKKQPHSFDASLLPKLAFIKGEFLLAVSENTSMLQRFAYISRISCVERFVCVEINTRSASGLPKYFSE